MLAGLASVEEGARIFVLPRVQHVVAEKKTKSTGNQTMNRTTISIDPSKKNPENERLKFLSFTIRRRT
jgi:hypothetical protein